jgi:hypothetical protein
MFTHLALAHQAPSHDDAAHEQAYEMCVSRYLMFSKTKCNYSAQRQFTVHLGVDLHLIIDHTRSFSR